MKNILERVLEDCSVSHSKENRISLKASKPTMSLNRGNRGTTSRVVDFLVRDLIIGSMKTEETESSE